MGNKSKEAKQIFTAIAALNGLADDLLIQMPDRSMIEYQANTQCNGYATQYGGSLELA